MVGTRAYVAGKFGLELDGLNAGWLTGFDGGAPAAEVVTERIGADHLQHHHLGTVRYDDITLRVGTGMSQGFWRWIQDSFDRRTSRKNGAVIAADYNLRETSRLTFMNALVTELSLPALDASAHDVATVTVKIAPELTRNQMTTAGARVGGAQDRAKQRKWSRANFRLRIDGVDSSRVFQIDAIRLRQKVTPYRIGEHRDYQIEPVQIEYPNLVVTVPESHAGGFWRWHEDFVVRGRASEDNERGGTLEFLTPSLDETLFQLDFTRLGIFKATPDRAEGGSESIRRVKFEMYCEKVGFKYSQEAVWA